MISYNLEILFTYTSAGPYIAHSILVHLIPPTLVQNFAFVSTEFLFVGFCLFSLLSSGVLAVPQSSVPFGTMVRIPSMPSSNI